MCVCVCRVLSFSIKIKTRVEKFRIKIKMLIFDMLNFILSLEMTNNVIENKSD